MTPVFEVKEVLEAPKLLRDDMKAFIAYIFANSYSAEQDTENSNVLTLIMSDAGVLIDLDKKNRTIVFTRSDAKSKGWEDKIALYYEKNNDDFIEFLTELAFIPVFEYKDVQDFFSEF